VRCCLRCGESELTHPEPMDADAALIFGECPAPVYPAPLRVRLTTRVLASLLGDR
jgi:hypothetical protein